MKLRVLDLLPLVLLSVALQAAAQTILPFSVRDYRSFLDAHRDMTTSELLALHPAGTFSATAPVAWGSALYADSIDFNYHLTAYEKSLLEKHGFMATERLSTTGINAMSWAFRDIYHRDLPVFISTDAILHAVHRSYDNILKDVEVALLVRELDTLLTRLHDGVGRLALAYASDTTMSPMLLDVDLYLSVPRAILSETGTVTPVFGENTSRVAGLLALIAGQQPAQYQLFGSFSRPIDFSQFTPRGHYTDSKLLQRYFKAMMWLGRIEIWLRAPESAGPGPSDEDIQRQVIDAVLLDEAARLSDADSLLAGIDAVLRLFVGDVDNVSLQNIRDLAAEAGIVNAPALCDSTAYRRFGEALLAKAYAFQRINSQILMSDPLAPEEIKPASAFLLLGQRFVIDSYVTGNVVFDKIQFEGRKVMRMLPSTLDVLFALGNNAAGQLLAPQLDEYHYAQNLVGLRYLVDSYEPGFWSGTIYNSWLGAIRTLNPPTDRAFLPPFMQTAAWWQMKMTTQLASWAQLRHDNLLYAKQSYTGAPTCSYPLGYVEPLPEFFEAMHTLADSAAMGLRNLAQSDGMFGFIAAFFDRMRNTMDTLASIAADELAGNELTFEKQAFLRHMVSETNQGCVTGYSGWYPELYYNGFVDPSDNMVVADVHTAPADEFGNPVGWVLHAGTGPVDMAVIVASIPNKGPVAFVGPVLSSYEIVTENFKRLTDDEWAVAYAIPPSSRPSFVNCYLADANGDDRGEGASLLTGMQGSSSGAFLPAQSMLFQNYPNPFNPTTVIRVQLAGESEVKLVVYDVVGRAVAMLARGRYPAGQYLFTFDGSKFASGVYYAKLEAGSKSFVRPMMLVK